MRLIQSAMLGVALCALAGGAARAADKSAGESQTGIDSAPHAEARTFAELDKNNDGYISKAEAKADPEMAANFGKLDLNHDGKGSRAEYGAGGKKKETAPPY